MSRHHQLVDDEDTEDEDDEVQIIEPPPSRHPPRRSSAAAFTNEQINSMALSSNRLPIQEEPEEEEEDLDPEERYIPHQLLLPYVGKLNQKTANNKADITDAQLRQRIQEIDLEETKWREENQDLKNDEEEWNEGIYEFTRERATIDRALIHRNPKPKRSYTRRHANDDDDTSRIKKQRIQPNPSPPPPSSSSSSSEEEQPRQKRKYNKKLLNPDGSWKGGRPKKTNPSSLPSVKESKEEDEEEPWDDEPIGPAFDLGDDAVVAPTFFTLEEENKPKRAYNKKLNPDGSWNGNKPRPRHKDSSSSSSSSSSASEDVEFQTRDEEGLMGPIDFNHIDSYTREELDERLEGIAHELIQYDEFMDEELSKQNNKDPEVIKAYEEEMDLLAQETDEIEEYLGEGTNRVIDPRVMLEAKDHSGEIAEDDPNVILPNDEEEALLIERQGEIREKQSREMEQRIGLTDEDDARYYKYNKDIERLKEETERAKALAEGKEYKPVSRFKRPTLFTEGKQDIKEEEEKINAINVDDDDDDYEEEEDEEEEDEEEEEEEPEERLETLVYVKSECSAVQWKTIVDGVMEFMDITNRTNSQHIPVSRITVMAGEILCVRIYHISESESSISGFAIAQIYPATRVLELLSLNAVESGRLIVDKLQEYTTSKGYNTMRVYSTDNEVAFYKKMGFVPENSNHFKNRFVKRWTIAEDEETEDEDDDVMIIGAGKGKRERRTYPVGVSKGKRLRDSGDDEEEEEEEDEKKTTTAEDERIRIGLKKLQDEEDRRDAQENAKLKHDMFQIKDRIIFEWQSREHVRGGEFHDGGKFGSHGTTGRARIKGEVIYHIPKGTRVWLSFKYSVDPYDVILVNGVYVLREPITEAQVKDMNHSIGSNIGVWMHLQTVKAVDFNPKAPLYHLQHRLKKPCRVDKQDRLTYVAFCLYGVHSRPIDPSSSLPLPSAYWTYNYWNELIRINQPYQVVYYTNGSMQLQVILLVPPPLRLGRRRYVPEWRMFVYHLTEYIQGWGSIEGSINPLEVVAITTDSTFNPRNIITRLQLSRDYQLKHFDRIEYHDLVVLNSYLKQIIDDEQQINKWIRQDVTTQAFHGNFPWLDDHHDLIFDSGIDVPFPYQQPILLESVDFEEDVNTPVREDGYDTSSWLDQIYIPLDFYEPDEVYVPIDHEQGHYVISSETIANLLSLDINQWITDTGNGKNDRYYFCPRGYVDDEDEWPAQGVDVLVEREITKLRVDRRKLYYTTWKDRIVHHIKSIQARDTSNKKMLEQEKQDYANRDQSAINPMMDVGAGGGKGRKTRSSFPKNKAEMKALFSKLVRQYGVTVAETMLDQMVIANTGYSLSEHHTIANNMDPEQTYPVGMGKRTRGDRKDEKDEKDEKEPRRQKTPARITFDYPARRHKQPSGDFTDDVPKGTRVWLTKTFSVDPYDVILMEGYYVLREPIPVDQLSIISQSTPIPINSVYNKNKTYLYHRIEKPAHLEITGTNKPDEKHVHGRSMDIEFYLYGVPARGYRLPISYWTLDMWNSIRSEYQTYHYIQYNGFPCVHLIPPWGRNSRRRYVPEWRFATTGSFPWRDNRIFSAWNRGRHGGMSFMGYLTDTERVAFPGPSVCQEMLQPIIEDEQKINKWISEDFNRDLFHPRYPTPWNVKALNNGIGQYMAPVPFPYVNRPIVFESIDYNEAEHRYYEDNVYHLHSWVDAFEFGFSNDHRPAKQPPVDDMTANPDTWSISGVYVNYMHGDERKELDITLEELSDRFYFNPLSNNLDVDEYPTFEDTPEERLVKNTLRRAHHKLYLDVWKNRIKDHLKQMSEEKNERDTQYQDEQKHYRDRDQSTINPLPSSDEDEDEKTMNPDRGDNRTYPTGIGGGKGGKIVKVPYIPFEYATRDRLYKAEQMRIDQHNQSIRKVFKDHPELKLTREEFDSIKNSTLSGYFMVKQPHYDDTKRDSYYHVYDGKAYNIEYKTVQGGTDIKIGGSMRCFAGTITLHNGNQYRVVYFIRSPRYYTYLGFQSPNLLQTIGYYKGYLVTEFLDNLGIMDEKYNWDTVQSPFLQLYFTFMIANHVLGTHPSEWIPGKNWGVRIAEEDTELNYTQLASYVGISALKIKVKKGDYIPVLYDYWGDSFKFYGTDYRDNKNEAYDVYYTEIASQSHQSSLDATGWLHRWLIHGLYRNVGWREAPQGSDMIWRFFGDISMSTNDMIQLHELINHRDELPSWLVIELDESQHLPIKEQEYEWMYREDTSKYGIPATDNRMKLKKERRRIDSDDSDDDGEDEKTTNPDQDLDPDDNRTYPTGAGGGGGNGERPISFDWKAREHMQNGEIIYDVPRGSQVFLSQDISVDPYDVVFMNGGYVLRKPLSSAEMLSMQATLGSIPDIDIHLLFIQVSIDDVEQNDQYYLFHRMERPARVKITGFNQPDERHSGKRVCVDFFLYGIHSRPHPPKGILPSSYWTVDYWNPIIEEYQPYQYIRYLNGLKQHKMTPGDGMVIHLIPPCCRSGRRRYVPEWKMLVTIESKMHKESEIGILDRWNRSHTAYKSIQSSRCLFASIATFAIHPAIQRMYRRSLIQQKRMVQEIVSWQKQINKWVQEDFMTDSLEVNTIKNKKDRPVWENTQLGSFGWDEQLSKLIGNYKADLPFTYNQSIILEHIDYDDRWDRREECSVGHPWLDVCLYKFNEVSDPIVDDLTKKPKEWIEYDKRERNVNGVIDIINADQPSEGKTRRYFYPKPRPGKPEEDADEWPIPEDNQYVTARKDVLRAKRRKEYIEQWQTRIESHLQQMRAKKINQQNVLIKEKKHYATYKGIQYDGPDEEEDEEEDEKQPSTGAGRKGKRKAITDGDDGWQSWQGSPRGDDDIKNAGLYFDPISLEFKYNHVLVSSMTALINHSITEDGLVHIPLFGRHETFKMHNVIYSSGGLSYLNRPISPIQLRTFLTHVQSLHIRLSDGSYMEVDQDNIDQIPHALQTHPIHLIHSLETPAIVIHEKDQGVTKVKFILFGILGRFCRDRTEPTSYISTDMPDKVFEGVVKPYQEIRVEYGPVLYRIIELMPPSMRKGRRVNAEQWWMRDSTFYTENEMKKYSIYNKTLTHTNPTDHGLRDQHNPVIMPFDPTKQQITLQSIQLEQRKINHWYRHLKRKERGPPMIEDQLWLENDNSSDAADHDPFTYATKNSIVLEDKDNEEQSYGYLLHPWLDPSEGTHPSKEDLIVTADTDLTKWRGLNRGTRFDIHPYLWDSNEQKQMKATQEQIYNAKYHMYLKRFHKTIAKLKTIRWRQTHLNKKKDEEKKKDDDDEEKDYATQPVGAGKNKRRLEKDSDEEDEEKEEHREEMVYVSVEQQQLPVSSLMVFSYQTGQHHYDNRVIIDLDEIHSHSKVYFKNMKGQWIRQTNKKIQSYNTLYYVDSTELIKIKNSYVLKQPISWGFGKSLKNMNSNIHMIDERGIPHITMPRTALCYLVHRLQKPAIIEPNSSVQFIMYGIPNRLDPNRPITYHLKTDIIDMPKGGGSSSSLTRTFDEEQHRWLINGDPEFTSFIVSDQLTINTWAVDDYYNQHPNANRGGAVPFHHLADGLDDYDYGDEDLTFTPYKIGDITNENDTIIYDDEGEDMRLVSTGKGKASYKAITRLARKKSCSSSWFSS